MNLRNRAEQHHQGAGEQEPAQTSAPATPWPVVATDLDPVVLPESTSVDPEQVSVFVAWGRVMRDIGSIGKGDRVSAGGAGTYSFRGVDRTVNAFGPVCRRHGVMVIPTGIRSTHEDARTSGGKATRETTVIVSWRIYGPAGDWIEGESEGESLDSSDKGTAKAQSIALRVFLLAAGMVPTEDQADDSHVERGERQTVNAADYVDEVCHRDTSLARLTTIASEVQRYGIGIHDITNELGDTESLAHLVWRKRKERKENGEQA